MPVAPFIPAIIAAGAGVGGALINKSASDNATEAESEAADKAIQLTKEMYEQDRADFMPYQNLGAYSVGQLGHLVGMPENFGQQAVQQATTPTARTAVPREPMSLLDRGRAFAEQAQTRRAEQEPSSLLHTLRDLGAARQTASSFVRMRAPNGEESDVDPREAALFEAQGARRIS